LVADRVYERHSSLFAPVVHQNFAKTVEISKLSAELFGLPRDIFTGDISGVSISELFLGHRFYREAGYFLTDALLVTNPIDALYAIHKTLVGIRKGALIDRVGQREASPADVNRAFPFDDLFALFFGTLMGTGPPIVDIFHIARVVAKYTPKQCLAPQLDFAKATLEALEAHIVGLNLGELQAKKESRLTDV
jgi:hypothetical protein